MCVWDSFIPIPASIERIISSFQEDESKLPSTADTKFYLFIVLHYLN